MPKTDEDLIAAYLAKGGKVTQVAEGETNGMANKDWRRAVRGEAPPSPPQAPTEQESELYTEHVREAALVGGQAAAIQAMNDWRRPRRQRPMSRAAREAQEAYNREWGVEY